MQQMMQPIGALKRQNFKEEWEPLSSSFFREERPAAVLQQTSHDAQKIQRYDAAIVASI